MLVAEPQAQIPAKGAMEATRKIRIEGIRPNPWPDPRSLLANGRSPNARENGASFLTRLPVVLPSNCAPGRMVPGLAYDCDWGIFIVRFTTVWLAPAAIDAGEKAYVAP